MKKFNFIAGCFIVAVILIIGYDMVKSSPDKIVLQPGWQKMQQVIGEIPQGSVMVVSVDSALTLPGDSQSTGFVSRGVIVFNEKRYVVSKGPVWVFCPENYEFLLKNDGFLSQCDEKILDLTGGVIKKADNLYFVGHP